MSPSFQIIFPCVAFVLSACADNSRQDDNRQTSAPAGISSESASGPEQLARAVDCATAFESATVIYTMLASRSSGAERERLRKGADARMEAAKLVHLRAIGIAYKLKMTQADLQARVQAARQRHRQDLARGDFRDFAVRMDEKANRCAADLPKLL